MQQYTSEFDPYLLKREYARLERELLGLKRTLAHREDAHSVLLRASEQVHSCSSVAAAATLLRQMAFACKELAHAHS